jgi:hypothetical protein
MADGASALTALTLCPQAFFYLSSLGDPLIEKMVLERMRTATNMTDEESAFSILVHECWCWLSGLVVSCFAQAKVPSSRELAFEEFFEKWKVIIRDTCSSTNSMTC